MLDADRRTAATRLKEEPTIEPRLEDSAENLHVWLAALGIAMQPISTATGNIGLGVAALGLGLRMSGVVLERRQEHGGRVAGVIRRERALLKSRRLLHAWIELVRRPWFWCLLGWLAWSWLSLAWSPDRRFGVEQFRATRVLLWIPLLWPIRHHWRTLVGSILAGTTMMAALQATQVRFGWPASPFPPGSGLTTPTQTGLWAAVALSFWLIITVSVNLLAAASTLPFAALAGLSLVWSATRASAMGLLVELVIANAVLALTSRGWLLRAALRCVVGAVILGASVVLAGSYLQNKVSLTVQSLQSTRGMTTEIRIAMWSAALDGWRANPLAGVGIGGIPAIMARTDLTTPDVDLRTVRMIHSTYLQTLAETGVVGLGALLAFAALLFRDVLRGLRGQPLLVASFGALVVWFVAAAFDGYQQSGGFLTVGAILIPLSLARLSASTDENAATVSC